MWILFKIIFVAIIIPKNPPKNSISLIIKFGSVHAITLLRDIKAKVIVPIRAKLIKNSKPIISNIPINLSFTTSFHLKFFLHNQSIF